MRKRKNRNKSELDDVLKHHVLYELNMLIIIANAVVSGIAGKSPLNNSLIESFAIHVRNLIDFLWPVKPSNDHVISNDFFGNNEWITIRPEIPVILKKARIRANKEISHISYDRLKVKPENKPWDFISITNEISSVMDLFIKNYYKRNRI
jgi:hypothetical protein